MRENVPAAYQLMGEIEEGLGQKKDAITNFKRFVFYMITYGLVGLMFQLFRFCGIKRIKNRFSNKKLKYS